MSIPGTLEVMDHPEIDERTRLIALALTRGIGWKLLHRLLVRFGSYEAALAASAEELRMVQGVGKHIAARIQAIDTDYVANDLQRFAAQHIAAVTWQDSTYPLRLASLNAAEDRPLTLFWKGALLASDVNAVAIVGTRQPQQASTATAQTWAEAFARCGWTIVSGLARGIDTAAHRGALDAGGRTLAVLGGGVNRVYPRENVPLAREIIDSGALISEVHPDTSPSPNALVRRNRVITGLSRATIVVEAGTASGALYAAHRAHDQGRAVFAVDNSAGNADLLAKFAYLLPDQPDDIDRLIEQIERHEKLEPLTPAPNDQRPGSTAVDGFSQMMLL